MKQLRSYLAGEWHVGTGTCTTLENPATEQPLAEIHLGGYNVAAAFAYARTQGAASMGELTFAQRGELLSQAAKAIHGAREELLDLAVANGGNTRSDAKFDVDGASGTLAYYAELGKQLGSERVRFDGDPIQVGRTARFSGQHVWTTLPGVALQINAFNFPAWGLAEKAACALLAGMPVICKPATATALVAHRIVELLAPLLPDGALQLYLGSPSTLMDAVSVGDVVSFTGSSHTATALRGHSSVLRDGVRLGIEADSLNAAVLGNISVGSETFALAVNDVCRDMTQKAGQKCTAIRRVLVPGELHADFIDALRERLKSTQVGNPALDTVRMGPLATRGQYADVLGRLDGLRAATDSVFDQPVHPIGTDGKGYFVGPTLRAAAADNATVHASEIFGPVTTVCKFDGSIAEAAKFIARGGGSLCSSVYSDDREFLVGFAKAAAPWLGRLYMGSEKMAAMSLGPGAVLPQLLHGGPGRAGGGEELGGSRGLERYMQRTALQGDLSLIKGL